MGFLALSIASSNGPRVDMYCSVHPKTELAVAYAKWAELDAGNPMVKALGPDGAAKVLAKFTGVATLVEQVIGNRQADLSFWRTPDFKVSTVHPST